MSEIRIGISGWTYAPWREVFFPKGWPQKRELEYASRRVGSIEINGSFYSLQRPSSYRSWYDATPAGFRFSVKGSRFITHLKRLKDVEKPLANFFAQGLLCLREKLGPILWQLPPNFSFDADRLKTFFDLLPRDTHQAALLARRHDRRLKGKAATKEDDTRPIRHVMEIRHSSFECAEFVELLRRENIGLVVADTAGKWPLMEDVTSDLVYVRLHGDEKLYESGYTDDALKEWARKIRAWKKGATPRGAKLHSPQRHKSEGGCDVFVYFDNDVKVHAPFDAMSLAHRLGVGPKPSDFPKDAEVAAVARKSWPGAVPQGRSSRKARAK